MEAGKNSPNVSRIRYYAETNGTTILYWHAAFATFLGRGLSIRPTIPSSSVFITRSAGAFPARLDSLIELVTDPLRRAAKHNVERLRSTIGARHEAATELSAGSTRFYFH